MVNLPSGKQVEEWKYYRENYVPPNKKICLTNKKTNIKIKKKINKTNK